MEHSLTRLTGPAVSEEEFSLILQLAQGPPSPLYAGLGQWTQMYRLASESHDIRGITYAIQNLFNALNSAGRSAEALLCARRLLAIGRETGDPLLVCHAVMNFAAAKWVIGDHVAAWNAAQQALRFARSLDAKPLLHAFSGPEAIRKAATDLLLNLKLSRSQLRRGLADYEAMLRIHRASGDVLQMVSSMEGLGHVHKELGDNSAAFRWFSAALQELEGADIPDARVPLLTRAGLLGNIGVVLTNMGETTEALERIEEASGIYSQLSDSFGQIATSGQRGRALLRAGHTRESVDSFATMLQLARRHDTQSWQQAAYFNLARAYLALGDRLEAAVHCERAVALAREKLGHLGVDLCWLRAALFHSTSPPTGGVVRADVARFIALAYYAFDALRSDVRSSKPSAVVERWIDEFEAIIQAVLSLPPTEPLIISPVEYPGGQSAHVWASLVSLNALASESRFVGWPALEIGLYCIESLRAQEFQERLLLNTADLELRHDQQLIAELSVIEAELRRLQSAPPIVVSGTASFDESGNLVMREPASAESITKQEHAQKEYVRRVAELSAARDALAERTLESSDTPAAVMQDPARLSDIRGVLRDDEMFLEFVLLGQSGGGNLTANEVVLIPSATRPDGAFAIGITRSWMDVVPLGATAAIEAQCRKLLDMINRFGIALSLPFFQTEATGLFDLLLRPVLDRADATIDTVRHIVIATDGILNTFPLDLLVEEQREAHSWRDLAYLARLYSTEYTPSSTVFVDSRLGRYRRGDPGQAFIGFGDPSYTTTDGTGASQDLPGTRKELEAIAALIRGEKGVQGRAPIHLFLGPDARKDQLSDSKVLLEAEYLHLACHGTAGGSPYHDGALFLTDDQHSDPARSILTPREVMDLRTRARLVIMSACESGLGKLTKGEGVQGLVRAWLFAGAQSVVATLWKVEDDATATLMEALYKNLLTSPVCTTDALATAKRAAIEDELLACPVFWAAFVVFGGRPGNETRQRTATIHLDQAATPDHDLQVDVAVDPLSSRARTVLGECGRAWETAWHTNDRGQLRAFFDASAELATRVKQLVSGTDENPTDVALGLVNRNCRLSWEYWTKQRQASLAVHAYRAYAVWEPSVQSEGWDALDSAYGLENLQMVRDFARRNLLRREYEMLVNGSTDVSIVTTVTRVGTDARTSSQEDGRPLKVALPVDDPRFQSTSAEYSYCHDIGWLVFPLRPGERVRLTEYIPSSVHVLESDTFLVGGIWGSSLFPHILTIRFHKDFIPISFQRQQMGKVPSLATLRFTPEGALVMLRPVGGAWLDRIAVVFRRVPGASASFAAPGSPFLEETDFEEFMRLLEIASGQQSS